MNRSLHINRSRLFLIAGLALGIASAHAASGLVITQAQEKLVSAGMTTDEVLLALGRPDRAVAYKYESGPTWSYRIVGDGGGMNKFYVDFDARGKVASVMERDESN